MKNFLFFVLTLAAIISGCAILRGSAGEGEVYEGTGQGYRGTITVQVRISEGNITEIVIADSAEDRLVGGAAMEELIDAVIEYNSTDVDAVTGATESSRGFLEAIENAILKQWETVYFVE